MSLPRAWRLRQGEAFRQVRRAGRAWSNRWLVLFAWAPAEPEAGPARVGFSVGRRIGKAVRRNRIRRLLVEAYRQLAPRVRPGWWLVVVAREPARELDLPGARRALEELLRRARLLRPPEEAGGLHHAGAAQGTGKPGASPAGGPARRGETRAGGAGPASRQGEEAGQPAGGGGRCGP